MQTTLGWIVIVIGKSQMQGNMSEPNFEELICEEITNGENRTYGEV